MNSNPLVACIAASMAMTLAASQAVSQPTLQWVATYDGPVGGEDSPSSAAIDREGNIVVVGQSMGATGLDWAIVKYDSDGNELWVRRHDGAAGGDDVARRICIDDTGAIYVNGTVDDNSAATAKYDAQGTLQWVHPAPANPHNASGHFLVVGNGNTYYAHRSVNGGPGTMSAHVSMYDKNGLELWSDTPISNGNGPPHPVIAGIHSDGSVYWVCVVYRAPAFGEFVVIRYDSQGNVLWNKSYAWSEPNAPMAAIDSEGNLYCTSYNSSGQNIIFKLNASGDRVYWRVDRRELQIRVGFAMSDPFFYVSRYESWPNPSAYITAYSLSSGGTGWVTTVPHNPDWYQLQADTAGSVYVGFSQSVPISATKLDKDGVELWSIMHQSAHGEKTPLHLVAAVDEVLLLGHGSSVEEQRDFILVKYAPEAACYPDCDPSTGVGVLDIFDFLCFQNSFVSGEPYACDCDTSTGLGVCDVFDFLCFQNAFVGGCP